ncbi:MAG: hypothetical protein IKZ07_07210 [Akkermansia sp.]|nr:hypothetical protein [Akkermansia sp.]
MLTQEQIKKLKTDDKLLVHGKFVKAHDNGSILVSLFIKVWEASINELIFFHPSSLSLPSEHGTLVPIPKYDPTRLFKKGDKVRVVEWNGRKVHDPINGAVWTVNRNERDGGIAHESILVSLFYEDDKEGHIIDIPPCFLELVTPVEELEPYSIDKANTNVLFKYGLKFATFEDDDEAQELCDRLNAEYRKEHAHD